MGKRIIPGQVARSVQGGAVFPEGARAAVHVNGSQMQIRTTKPPHSLVYVHWRECFTGSFPSHPEGIACADYLVVGIFCEDALGKSRGDLKPTAWSIQKVTLEQGWPVK